MSWREILSLKGTNLWHIANSVGWNILWTSASLLITSYTLERVPEAAAIFQNGLMVSVFLGSLTAGFVLGKLADDGRGMTYGVIGSLGSVALALFIVLPSGGILGLMLAIIAIAGGLNGGLLSLRKSSPK